MLIYLACFPPSAVILLRTHETRWRNPEQSAEQHWGGDSLSQEGQQVLQTFLPTLVQFPILSLLAREQWVLSHPKADSVGASVPL